MIDDSPTRRGRGRPTKLSPQLADELVEALAAGTTVTEAAAAVGIDRRTVAYWRQRGRSGDPGFAELERRLDLIGAQSTGEGRCPEHQ